MFLLAGIGFVRVIKKFSVCMQISLLYKSTTKMCTCSNVSRFSMYIHRHIYIGLSYPLLSPTEKYYMRNNRAAPGAYLHAVRLIHRLLTVACMPAVPSVARVRNERAHNADM